MACMVLGEKMKPGDTNSPAAMGDGVGAGAAWRCPSVSSRGSPPSSAAAAGETKLATYGGKDDDVAGAGLPVSRCTTVMNSCGLAWTTLGVCSYTITGFLEPDGGLDDGAVGDEPLDDADTFSGSGRGPRKPLLEGDDEASEEAMATVMVMAASPSSPSLLATPGSCRLLARLYYCPIAMCPTKHGALQ